MPRIPIPTSTPAVPVRIDVLALVPVWGPVIAVWAQAGFSVCSCPEERHTCGPLFIISSSTVTGLLNMSVASPLWLPKLLRARPIDEVDND